MSVTSNRLTWKASAVSAWEGPDHQVTTAETAPARTAAPGSCHPVLTASQRSLVMLCVQANWCVPVSSSCATIGAPQNSPGSSGTADVAPTSVTTAEVLWDTVEATRLQQVPLFAHPARAQCHSCAACSSVSSSTTASTANSAAASARW